MCACVCVCVCVCVRACVCVLRACVRACLSLSRYPPPTSYFCVKSSNSLLTACIVFFSFMQNLCTRHQTLCVQSGVMKKCGQCGKRGDTNTLRRCSRCQAIRYCSRDCQARHWPQHKVTCTPTTNPAASPASAKTGTGELFQC